MNKIQIPVDASDPVFNAQWFQHEMIETVRVMRENGHDRDSSWAILEQVFGTIYAKHAVGCTNPDCIIKPWHDVAERALNTVYGAMSSKKIEALWELFGHDDDSEVGGES